MANKQLQCLHFSKARYAMSCFVKVSIFQNLAENGQFWGVHEDSKVCGYLGAIATNIFGVNNPNIEGSMVQYITGVNNQLQCLHFSEVR